MITLNSFLLLLVFLAITLSYQILNSSAPKRRLSVVAYYEFTDALDFSRRHIDGGSLVHGIEMK